MENQHSPSRKEPKPSESNKALQRATASIPTEQSTEIEYECEGPPDEYGATWQPSGIAPLKKGYRVQTAAELHPNLAFIDKAQGWPSAGFGLVTGDVLDQLRRDRETFSSKGFSVHADPVNPLGDGKSWALKCEVTDELVDGVDPFKLAEQCQSECVQGAPKPFWQGKTIVVPLWGSNPSRESGSKTQAPQDYKEPIERLPLYQSDTEWALKFGPDWKIVKELRQILQQMHAGSTPELVKSKQENIQLLRSKYPVVAEQVLRSVETAEQSCTICGHEKSFHVNDGPCLFGTGAQNLAGKLDQRCPCNQFAMPLDLGKFETLAPELVSAVRRGDKKLDPRTRWGFRPERERQNGSSQKLRFIKHQNGVTVESGFNDEQLLNTYESLTGSLAQVRAIVLQKKGRVSVSDLKNDFKQTELYKAANDQHWKGWIRDFCDEKASAKAVALVHLEHVTGKDRGTLKTRCSKARQQR